MLFRIVAGFSFLAFIATSSAALACSTITSASMPNGGPCPQEPHFNYNPSHTQPSGGHVGGYSGSGGANYGAAIGAAGGIVGGLANVIEGAQGLLNTLPSPEELEWQGLCAEAKAMFDKNAAMHQADQESLRPLEENKDYVGLCKFGQSTGIPEFTNEISEMQRDLYTSLT